MAGVRTAARGPRRKGAGAAGLLERASEGRARTVTGLDQDRRRGGLVACNVLSGLALAGNQRGSGRLHVVQLRLGRVEKAGVHPRGLWRDRAVREDRAHQLVDDGRAVVTCRTFALGADAALPYLQVCVCDGRRLVSGGRSAQAGEDNEKEMRQRGGRALPRSAL